MDFGKSQTKMLHEYEEKRLRTFLVKLQVERKASVFIFLFMQNILSEN